MFAFLAKLVAGPLVSKAFDGVTKLIHDHMADKESAKELNLKVNAHVREVLGNSKNWFVADAHALILWVTGLGMAFYILPRFALASFDWVVHYASTGELERYPISTEELWHLLAITGSFGTLTMVNKAIGAVTSLPWRKK